MDNKNSELINKIRMVADLRLVDSPRIFETRESVRLKSGDSVTFEFLLLSGGEIADVSKIGSLKLEILDVGEINSPSPRSIKLLATKSLLASEINVLSSVDDFKNGDYNASFSFSQNETCFRDGHKWLNLVAYMKDGGKSTFAQGWIDVFAQYSSDDLEIEPPVEDSPFLRKDYADARYLSASENLIDVADIDASRENLNVYSKQECDAKDDVLFGRISKLENSKEGSFYFAKNATLNTSLQKFGNCFSCAFAMSMSLSSFLKNEISKNIVGTLDEWDENLGWNISRTSDDCAAVNYFYLDGNGTLCALAIDLSVSQTAMLFDGEYHSCVFVLSEDKISFFVDGNLFGYLDIPSAPTEIYLKFCVSGEGAKFSRIAVFNFDMSAKNTPYKIEDYAATKSIPPALLREIKIYDSSNNWKPNVPANFSVTKSNDELTITTTADYNMSYIWVRLTQLSLKALSSMRFVYDNFETNVPFIFNNPYFMIRKSGVTIFEGIPNGGVVTLPCDADEIRVWIVMASNQASRQFSTGEWLKFTGLKIEINGALLSLDDAISGVQVLDKSTNKNHATIYGKILADKQNKMAMCSDSKSFSWAGTATTQYFANSDVAIPSGAVVTAYAKATTAGTFSFKCSANSVETKELNSNVLVEVLKWTNNSEGAFAVTPASSYTGSMEVFLKIEQF